MRSSGARSLTRWPWRARSIDPVARVRCEVVDARRQRTPIRVQGEQPEGSARRVDLAVREKGDVGEDAEDAVAGVGPSHSTSLRVTMTEAPLVSVPLASNQSVRPSLVAMAS